MSTRVFLASILCSVIVPPASFAQRFASPGNAFYRYDANDGEGAAGSGSAFDALDGTWSHDNGSDEWDGTELGAGRPGGVTVAGGILQVQDPGDPRDHGMGDPGSNRKVYLGHDLSSNGASGSQLDEGVTLYFRARVAPGGDDLHPDGGGAITPYPVEGDGYVIHDGGKGPIGIKQADGGIVSFGLATAFDSASSGGAVAEAGLVTNNLNGTAVSGDVDQQGGLEGGMLNLLPIDTLSWHDYYVTVQSGGTGTHRVTVYLDGDLSPAAEFDVTAGSGSDFGGITYLAIGQGATPQSGSFQLDFVVVAPGASPPSPLEIQLGDITRGGNGLGTAATNIQGVDPRGGVFTPTSTGAHLLESNPEGDGLNPSPVPDSDFIDSVFFLAVDSDLPCQDDCDCNGLVDADEIAGDAGLDADMDGTLDVCQQPGHDPTYPLEITQSGVTLDMRLGDHNNGRIWNVVLGDQNGGGGTLGVMNVGGFTLNNGVGIHASGGITYDLDALRAEYGDLNVGCFQTFWGVDGCGSADLNLYAVLSNDGGPIISAMLPGATANTGDLLQLDIPSSAQYLTLMTGTNGPPDNPAADGCDHGNFGAAIITRTGEIGFCADVEITDVTLSPDGTIIRPGDTVQLTVTGGTKYGFGLDLTLDSTLESSDEAVLTVDPDGLVTATGTGVATITATFDDTTVSQTFSVEEFLDLGNLAAGGNGIAPPPNGQIGVNPDTGEFGTANVAGVNPTGANPQAVDSPFIDSVFLMTEDSLAISQAGVTFDFEAGDANGNGWDLVLDGREPDGPDFLDFGAAGTYLTGVGCHASQGITYDLDGLRVEHGNDAVRFISAVAGETRSGGSVNAYVILSSTTEILDSARVGPVGNGGEFVQLPIPANARFATLAVGAAGNGIGGDHGGFGLARITAAPVNTFNLETLSVSPGSAVLGPGEQLQLGLNGTLGVVGLQGAPLTLDPSGANYASSDEAVATVSGSGLITAVGSGVTEITATRGALSDSITVTVALKLSDMVGGGDGTGTALEGVIGIDPRNGAFTMESIGGHLRESDAQGDGINPSPVGDSDLIDSVFFFAIDNALPTTDPYGLEITQSGVTFDMREFDHNAGRIWNHILKDQAGGGGAPLVGGVERSSAVGIHASGGVTFDLEAIRAAHGANAAATFSAIFGMDACTGDVNLFAIASGDDGCGPIRYKTFNATQNSGSPMELDISDASYLTLATGSNGGDGCDHGTFGDPILVGGVMPECPTEGDSTCSGFTVTASGPPGEPGTYTVTANATDDSGDGLFYTFVVDGEVFTQTQDSIILDLTEGTTAPITISAEVDDDCLCTDPTSSCDAIQITAECPADGDTHCPPDGLAVTQVDGPAGEAGTYRAEVTGATDDSGDAILYTFTIQKLGGNGGFFPTSIGPQTGNAAEFRLGGGSWSITATVDDNTLCPDEAADAVCGPAEVTVSCPAEGDTMCTDLIVESLSGENTPGTYRATATADDTSGDAIFYTFAITTVNGRKGPADPVVIGPQESNVAEFDLGGGTFSISATASDDPGCPDAGDCAPVEVVVESDAPIFRRGDTDGNGSLDVTDPINNLSFQFLGTFTPPCRDAADFDDNGKIEVTDPIANLSHQFLGEAPPPAPGKETCGIDPTDDDANGNGTPGEDGDDLGCEQYPAATAGPEAACE